MAAAAEDYHLKSDPTCGVCLEVFTDPVSLSCKHIFCSSCLRGVWEQATIRKCPICRRKSSKEIPLHFKKTELSDGAGTSEFGETEDKRPVVCSKHPEEPKLLKWRKVEENYQDMIRFSEKQLQSTEGWITAEFNKLHKFLREEEESRLAALREEKERKHRTISRELNMIQEQISSLAKDPQVPSVAAHSSLSDPQLLSGALIDVAKHLGNLSFRVLEKMKEKVHFSPVTLDPNTASSCLYLCEDLTSVRHGDTMQKVPENPERFTNYTTVLGSEGFTSGSHSWEVEVGDHPGWIVGLAKETVNRKQEMHFSPENGMWCLLYHNGKYTAGTGAMLGLKKSVQRVRVQLDYNLGKVSFYDHHDSTHIYTHKDTFTEKLFPYFAVGSAGDAKTTSIKIHQAEVSL